jgi:uncharacterized membrane protein
MAAHDSEEGVFPTVRRVPVGAPLRWIAAGWADLRAAPGVSLFYGAAFATMGWALYAAFSFAVQYVSSLTGAFLLIGPFMATGLYEMARRREAGEPVTLAPTLAAWRGNTASIGIFVLILLVICLVWARASLVTFALFFDGPLPTLENFLLQLLALRNLEFLVAWFAVGFLFAAIVYAISAVSIPMLLVRRAEAPVAALTSVRAILLNPVAMLLWAALVAALVVVGVATLFVGLVVTGPLVGLATWHAFRDLVE